MQTKRMTFPGRFLPYALLAPQVIVTLIFFIWPAGQALYQSLLREDAFGLRTTFVGLENFSRLFRDGNYLNSLSVTAIFAIGTTLLSMAAARCCSTRFVRLMSVISVPVMTRPPSLLSSTRQSRPPQAVELRP